MTMKRTFSMTLLALLGLGVAASPSAATIGNTAFCRFELYGKYTPGLTDLVLPASSGTASGSGPATCSGQALGRDLPKEAGTMTVHGRIGSGVLGSIYGDSCLLGNDTFTVDIVWPATDSHPSLHLSGWDSSIYSSDGVSYGELGGEQEISQYGWGGNPDEHYGTCTKSDPLSRWAVAGRELLFDGQSSQGVAQQHVITAFQYLPSGSVSANPTGLTAPFLTSYPVTQGDSLTFTNLDTHPHTVTACAAPCTDFPDQTSSGTFDGDVHFAGDQYTIDTSRLAPGTYHYFCQFHPFMRGSFVVRAKPGLANLK